MAVRDSCFGWPPARRQRFGVGVSGRGVGRDRRIAGARWRRTAPGPRRRRPPGRGTGSRPVRPPSRPVANAAADPRSGGRAGKPGTRFQSPGSPRPGLDDLREDVRDAPRNDRNSTRPPEPEQDPGGRGATDPPHPAGDPQPRNPRRRSPRSRGGPLPAGRRRSAAVAAPRRIPVSPNGERLVARKGDESIAPGVPDGPRSTMPLLSPVRTGRRQGDADRRSPSPAPAPPPPRTASAPAPPSLPRRKGGQPLTPDPGRLPDRRETPVARRNGRPAKRPRRAVAVAPRRAGSSASPNGERPRTSIAPPA